LLSIDKVGGITPIPWAELEPDIRKLLAKEGKTPGYVNRISLPAYRAFQAIDVQKRCKAWQEQFQHLFEPHPQAYAYDPQKWRREALEGDTNWDNYSENEWVQMLPRKAKPGFWDSLWVHFHRAALRQRHFVLENLP
jgi:hypothetical protein